MFAAYATDGTARVEVDYGDQGLARNDAVAHSTGRYIAMLDGDDLWQRNWLVLAWQFIDQNGDDRLSRSSRVQLFFEGQANYFRQIDQDSPDFDIDVLRLRNYWDALSMCHRGIHETFPYAKRDIRAGWAHEDWQWNVSTIANGIRHKIVPNTVVFKRRQKASQNIRASYNKSRIRRSELASYSHPLYKNFQ
ncbi:MAG: glycosyltransferase family A protein [Gammaproteobacteria bacterium]|nr:glycosyltransferase family A protein [Gammaproteobacteria bacterium]